MLTDVGFLLWTPMKVWSTVSSLAPVLGGHWKAGVWMDTEPGLGAHGVQRAKAAHEL